MSSRSLSLKLWLLTHGLWLAVVAAVWFFARPVTDPASSSSQDDRHLEGRGVTPGAALLTGGAGGRHAGSKGGQGDLAGVNMALRRPITEAMTEALEIKDPVERMARFSSLLRHLNKENLAETLAVIEEAPREEGDDALLVNFMRAWVRLDPSAAMDYALNNDETRKFYVSNSDDTLMKEWARRDPDAAMAYLDEIPRDHPQNRASLHSHLVEALVESDLSGAASYAQENTFGRERGRSIDLLASAFMKEGGPEALRSWLSGIDETNQENRLRDYKEYALGQAAQQLARKQPDEAVALVEAYAGTDLLSSHALSSAARGLAKDDPEGAMGWLMDFPENGDRSRAVASTLERWADREPNEAGRWLQSQELTPQMDPAVAAFSREIAREDPEAAFAWGMVINNERYQQDTLSRVGREWIRRDKAGMAEWFSQNEVPKTVADRFRRYFD